MESKDYHFNFQYVEEKGKSSSKEMSLLLFKHFDGLIAKHSKRRFVFVGWDHSLGYVGGFFVKSARIGITAIRYSAVKQ